MVGPAKDLDGLLISTGLTGAEEHDHRSGWEASPGNLDPVLAARR
jgi:hypothetical protein